MLIADILTPERMLCNVQATSKKRVLEYFSKLLATDSNAVTDRAIYESLLSREKLGSTGLGKGVAIPHARVEQCEVTLAAFLQTDQPIDFDAIDKQPVDLLFALVVPHDITQAHLDLLAHLAEMFSDDDFRKRLRMAEQCCTKYHLLSEWRSQL